MEQFITLYHDQIVSLKTSEVFAMWLKHSPLSGYDTQTRFTRAIRHYGYKTVTKRFGDLVARTYRRIADTEPVTIVCYCGHTHTHSE